VQDIRLLARLPALLALLVVGLVAGRSVADCSLIPAGSDRSCTNGVADLTGGDFTECDSTGTDFRGRDLTGAEFDFAVLDGIDASPGECTTPTEFIDPARFNGVDLRNVRMGQANLSGAEFKDGADLDSAHLTLSDFSGAIFAWELGQAASVLSGARLFGTSFDGADLSSTSVLDRIDASRLVALCVTDPSDGQRVCPSFNETNFSNADLRQSTFQNAEMIDTIFNGADLRGAAILGLTNNTEEWHPCCQKLPDSLECEVDPDTNLPVLSDPKVGPCIDFADAQMQSVIMTDTDFTQFWNTDNAVDFSDANLFEANLDGLDMTRLLSLERVNLQNAGLRGTDFSGAADTDGLACGDPADVDCMPMSGAILLGAPLSTQDTEVPPNVSVARFDDVDLSDAQLSTNADPDNGGLVAACQTWREPDDSPDPNRKACASFERALLRGAQLRGVDFLDLADFTDFDDSAVFSFATSLVKDLSDANLENAKLSSELVPADLGGYDLSRANLTGADLSQATLDDADLSEASLDAVLLVGTVFGSSGAAATLWGASLENATVCAQDTADPPVTTCADFQYADLFDGGGQGTRVNMRGIDFSLASDMLGIQSFKLLDLSSADLSGKDLSGIAFDGSLLAGTDLSGVDFGTADLSGADLTGAKLVGSASDTSPLPGADFSGAMLASAVTLAGVNLSDVSLCDVDTGECAVFDPAQSLQQVRMRRVDFTVYAEDTWAGRCFGGADLAGAAFAERDSRGSPDGLDLTGASFTESFTAGLWQSASLAGTDLGGVTLHGAVFDGADMTGALLDGADFCPDTPPGTPWSDPCAPPSPPSPEASGCARFDLARLRRASMQGFSISEYPVGEQQAFFEQVATVGGRSDLAQLDLTLANLAVTGGINLSNAELEQATLSGAILNDANLSGARLGRVTGECVVDSDGVQGTPGAEVCLRLTNAALDGAHLLSASLVQADLSGADFIGAGTSAAAVLDGADLTDATLLGTVLGGNSVPSASMVGANLTGATFCSSADPSSCATLEGVRLRDAVLDEQDFGLFDDPDLFTTLATIDDGDGQQRIDLGSASMRLSELAGMTLSLQGSLPGEDPWMGALLERSVIDAADLSGADLRYARMSRVSGQCVTDSEGVRGQVDAVVCTDLSGALLNGADLSRGRLLGSDLSDADLSAGPLTKKANLSDVDLTGADLSRIDLQYAILDRGIYGSADFAKDATTDEQGFCVGLSDPEKADLRDTWLLGTDFSQSIRFNEGCVLVDGSRYDENTLFPLGFSDDLKDTMLYVPEPGALASQLAVLGSLGALARRRRGVLRSSSRSASGPAR
jgi:uncharacterized protein YjbI with pentapeptide repeats